MAEPAPLIVLAVIGWTYPPLAEEWITKQEGGRHGQSR
jgi:hypothetical protein